jgi:hypothetical protein
VPLDQVSERGEEVVPDILDAACLVELLSRDQSGPVPAVSSTPGPPKRSGREGDLLARFEDSAFIASACCSTGSNSSGTRKAPSITSPWMLPLCGMRMSSTTSPPPKPSRQTKGETPASI